MTNISAQEALLTRRSVRAFLNKPVARERIEEILALASRAPSGSNIQPWQVIVLTGQPLKAFGESLADLCLKGVPGERPYQYYPLQWCEPYQARRRKVGWDLYNSVGIERGQKDKMVAQQARNYTFFDAPVGLIFTMDKIMETGSFLDMGMFMQSIMVAARGFGLDTCPQAAFIDYDKDIRRLLNIPDTQQLLCGMALGYRDDNAPENQFDTERVNVNDFTRFIGD